MNFSKLTLASFLAQAAFFNLAGTNKALCSATVLEQKEEGTLQDGDFSTKNSNLRGNKFNSSNRFLSSNDNGNQFIVKFKTHDDFVTEDIKLQSDPHQIMSLPDDDIEIMAFESEEELRYWEQRDDVEYVEPDYKVYPLAEHIPYGINSVKALSVSDASVSNQKVCIIDSGYDINHPDLQSSRSIVTGHSQVQSSPWTRDGNGHGTHVAGTIAAIGGNNQGVMGVNRNGQLKLHIVKIFDDNGRSTWTSDLIRAVENCAAAGATVVNMSLGHSTFSRAENDVMARIYNQGVLLVASAGNDGNSSKSYPASYSSVMSVGGVDSNNNKYRWSQFNDQVDIAAPGVGVWSTIPGGRYAKFNGTSMASPHVAGVAALVWSHFPTKTAQQIRQALESTAQDLGLAGRDDIFGHGLVRADNAFNCLADKCFTQPSIWVKYFGYNAGNWRVGNHPRHLVDVNGDGKADIVGFGNAGAYVSLSTGSGFTQPSIWVKYFGHNAGNWRVGNHPRHLVDVNGDGKADIVGFGNAGAYVSLSTGSGFTKPSIWVKYFGYNAGNWRVGNHPRHLVDVNGDGKADIVGFGNAGAYVSLA